ncbi:MAG: hypothetical protein ACTSUC_09975 [Promethearchaeota archaeon]
MRVISHSRGSPFYGITIPKHISMFFEDTFFNIYKSGNQIIMTSGCLNIPTKEEIEKYEFEPCRI